MISFVVGVSPNAPNLEARMAALIEECMNFEELVTIHGSEEYPNQILLSFRDRRTLATLSPMDSFTKSSSSLFSMSRSSAAFFSSSFRWRSFRPSSWRARKASIRDCNSRVRRAETFSTGENFSPAQSAAQPW